MGMDEALEFLRAVADIEHRARRAMLVEPDDKEFVKLRKEWDASFSGDMRSGLSRPLSKPPAHYKDPKRVRAAKQLQPRTVFAVARYHRGKTAVYRAWMGLYERGPRGEGMLDNFYAEVVDGDLKVVAHYRACLTCVGAGALRGGKKCTTCKGAGWVFEAGAKMTKLGAPEEIVKLEAPTDPASKPAYEAIDDTE